MIRRIIYILFYFKLSRVKKLKNIHKGETVYLIGDSVEFKYYDMMAFDNHPAIFFNKSYLFEGVENRVNKSYALTVEPYYYWSIFKKTTRKNEFRKFFLKKL